ncbi:MAG: M1 family metallopeptidase [Vulcanimicrobiota bacterium]
MCIHHLHQHSSSLRFEPPSRKGAASAGDSRIPGIGNGGYDAKHYDADIQVEPGGALDATSKMRAQATQDLDQLNIDFVGFDIESVKINGKEARYKREDGELIVTPARRLSKGQEFELQVDYNGQPQPLHSKHAPVPLGWNTFEGGSFVVSEPDGTRAWLPVNDHPTDKASYSFHINVPRPLIAAANGVLTAVDEQADSRTFHFEARDQMASYLSTVHVGEYQRFESQSLDGKVPIQNYFPTDLVAKAQRDFARVPEMMSFLTEKLGPYPFESYGNIVMDTNLGGAAALETQTLPLYDRGMVTGEQRMDRVLVHEMAHHWFGNSVSPGDWKDIWLNEGLASYCEMLWTEHDQGVEARDRALARAEQIVKRYGSSDPIAEPAADRLFDAKVYQGGALAIHALRKEVGDETFFEILKQYGTQHRDSTATTDDLVAISSAVSGKDLFPFFQRWVYSSDLPPVPLDTPMA